MFFFAGGGVCLNLTISEYTVTDGKEHIQSHLTFRLFGGKKQAN